MKENKLKCQKRLRLFLKKKDGWQDGRFHAIKKFAFIAKSNLPPPFQCLTLPCCSSQAIKALRNSALPFPQLALSQFDILRGGLIIVDDNEQNDLSQFKLKGCYLL